MKHGVIIAIIIACFVSCTNKLQEPNNANEESLVLQYTHLSQDDIAHVNGELVLSITLEEALKKGVAKSEYLKTENRIKVFNEYTKKVLKDLFPPTKSNAYPFLFTQGLLISPVDSQGYSSYYLGGLPQQDYILIYQFDSGQYVNHELNVTWTGLLPISFLENTMHFQGIDFEFDKGGDLSLTYQCDSIAFGGCLWQLYYIVYSEED